MKSIIAVALCLSATFALADNYTKGYMRKDGTYVAPHYKSESNSNRYDNYSSQGNSNPYTGQKGSQRNELSDTPAYNKNYGNTDYNSPYSKQKSGW